MTEALRPTRLVDRIDTLDVLRGVAICGILLMNIPGMGMIGTTERPAYPAALNADWIAWGVQGLLFSGTMRGLFTMLFGAGMLLMLRRAEGPGGEVTPVDVWTRRCLALLGLGIVQWLVLLWPGEILWCYGCTGFALLAFRTMRPRTLLLWAALGLATMTAADGWQSYGRVQQLRASIPAAAAQAAGRALTDEQRAALKTVADAREALRPTPATIAAERQRRTHWPAVIGWSWSFWSDLNFISWGWYDLLESLTFMLVGMALFRTGILTGQASRGTYLALIAAGYAGGLGLRLATLAIGARTGFEVVPDQPLAQAMLRGTIYEPARLLVTLGHLGLIVLLFRGRALGRAWPLRALGRMALTTYLLQSLVTSVLFYGFGLVGTFGFAGLMALAAAIWVGTGLFCVVWLRGHDQGPAEALLRAVAYDTFSPGRRQREAGDALAAAPAI